MAGAPQKNNENDLNTSSMKYGEPLIRGGDIDHKFDDHSLNQNSSVECGDYVDHDKASANLNLKTPTQTGQQYITPTSHVNNER